MLMSLLGVAAIVSFICYYISKPFQYWTKRGVEQGSPKWFFGHFWDYLIGKMSGIEIMQKIYEQNPNARYAGMYRFSTPVLVLKDPEIIKQVTTKDFEYKSPSFTSSKMRIIFTLMEQCAEKLTQHILSKDKEIVTVEIKHIFSRYANDVIATTAFGIKVDSLAQANNEFYQMGNEVADFSSICKTVKVIFWLVPPVQYFIKIQIISDETRAYFRGIINAAIKTREEKGIVRPDLLHLLLQARRVACNQDEDKVAINLSNEDITAHSLIFFIAGFESVSTFLSFTAYELAVNPVVHEKLKKEVQDTLQECGGNVTYDTILKMKYMDMVLSEALRKWPHFTGIERTCTKLYIIEPVTTEEKPIHIDKGTEIRLPMFAIHHDPKYFPNPERFDPERFSEENKGNIRPYTYFPFGLGPRSEALILGLLY